eukprot:TRINITY_DN41497_c0_g2_i2.p1 TRINITY_DN41497_c0_g2~~TRINITY_DN41497_c0_g2_i2.p1  ORF type:complete len:631 (-),score=79.83 TRINITY_DN41497_c0_g2_i2:22-1914(-)
MLQELMLEGQRKTHEARSKALHTAAKEQVLKSGGRLTGQPAFQALKRKTPLLVEDTTSRKHYMLKSSSKRSLLECERHNLANERILLSTIDSPFVCKLLGAYNCELYIWLLYETHQGCGRSLLEVYNHLGLYGSEEHARYYIACLCSGLVYLHSRQIVHRDLKMENLALYASGPLKISDLGNAKIIADRTYTLCGSPFDMAPEVWDNADGSKGPPGYSFPIDWWSTGVLLFELLAGFGPFEGAFLGKGIGSVTFPEAAASAKDIVSAFLEHEPEKRLLMRNGGGIDNLARHPWFKAFQWGSFEDQTMVPPPLSAEPFAIAEDATAPNAEAKPYDGGAEAFCDVFGELIPAADVIITVRSEQSETELLGARPWKISRVLTDIMNMLPDCAEGQQRELRCGDTVLDLALTLEGAGITDDTILKLASTGLPVPEAAITVRLASGEEVLGTQFMKISNTLKEVISMLPDHDGDVCQDRVLVFEDTVLNANITLEAAGIKDEASLTLLYKSLPEIDSTLVLAGHTVLAPRSVICPTKENSGMVGFKALPLDARTKVRVRFTGTNCSSAFGVAPAAALRQDLTARLYALTTCCVFVSPDHLHETLIFNLRQRQKRDMYCTHPCAASRNVAPDVCLL